MGIVCLTRSLSLIDIDVMSAKIGVFVDEDLTMVYTFHNLFVFKSVLMLMASTIETNFLLRSH